LVCVSALVIGSAALPAAAGSQAQSQKALCKKIRAAITAGHTLDQIMGEFHTDAQQVTKCLQKRGRRRATKVKKHQSSRSAAKPETRGSSSTGKPSDTPQQRAPRPRRLGPIP
jgi:hypothetical protein